MNRTNVWVARELRLRDAASASLLTETATNSRPVSAPATAARASPKLSHIAVAYPTGRLPGPRLDGRADSIRCLVSLATPSSAALGARRATARSRCPGRARHPPE